jgi:hypothetical protein
LKIAAPDGAPAYLSLDAADTTLAFASPGAPVVTSHDGGNEPVVWILDQSTPPVLYAIDGKSLAVLWKTGATDLRPGAAHDSVLIARATAFVAGDRLQAFGVAN